MVVSAQMEKPVHDEQTDFISKRHAIFRRLVLGYIWRKHDITQLVCHAFDERFIVLVPIALE